MGRRLLSLLLVSTLLLVGVPVGHARQTERPLVVFIHDEQLQTSLITDPGPDGISQLDSIFQTLGARTRWLSLATPLPRETAVIVLVRPLRPLPIDQLARLWVQVARGSNLLLAIDPPGLNSVHPDRTLAANPDRANSGLVRLLERYFGISLEDAFVVAPWFTHATISSQLTAYSTTFAEDFAPHPVVAPLVTYSLPVQVWGVRTVTVEPVGVDSTASPLLYTAVGYGETNTKIFDTQAEPAPLEINLGQDRVGRLLLGALGENRRLGVRVVVLGDSELVQNGFGLATNSRTGSPLHWGNRLLVERLAAWLLDLPQETWPAPPDGYTWIAVDGQPDDWPANPLSLEEDEDAPVAYYDIVRARAFRDNSYLYIYVETAQPPSTMARLTVGIENTYDGVTDVTLALDSQRILASSQQGTASAVLDGALGIGTVVEARLPLRVVGEGGLISAICLADRRTALDSAPLDCLEQPPAIVPVVNTQAPLDIWYPPLPMVTVYIAQADAANVRATPGTEAAVLDVAVNGRMFAVTGRTEAGDWVRVENARLVGWLADFVIRPNVEIQTLPVVVP